MGDCGGNGKVTVDEILTMVNIALGNAGASACQSGDANHDGLITVDEILTAVNNALNGCPGPTTYRLSGTIRYYGSSVPVAGATVELKGTTTLSVKTDANGQFTFDAVPAGVWQIQPAKIGGAGRAIDINDAILALKFSQGLATPSAEQQLACDVTGDGTITNDDAQLILGYTVGTPVPFPIAEACGSDWIFVPVPTAAPNQSVTRPLFSGGSCQPGSISFNPLSADAANQDFEAILIGDCSLSWSGAVPPTPAAGG